jgi:hypothetical protein
LHNQKSGSLFGRFNVLLKWKLSYGEWLMTVCLPGSSCSVVIFQPKTHMCFVADQRVWNTCFFFVLPLSERICPYQALQKVLQEYEAMYVQILEQS